eukprot:NODE_452_length_8270_cov_0.487823.p4 type:complete len:156 gc:universal NODE_452_length_8270_cov_0.487823:4810-5277(+)
MAALEQFIHGKNRNDLKPILQGSFQHTFKDSMIQHVSAILIQSWWKSILCRKYYDEVALQVSENVLCDDDMVFSDEGSISVQSEPLVYLINDQLCNRCCSDSKIDYKFATTSSSSNSSQSVHEWGPLSDKLSLISKKAGIAYPIIASSKSLDSKA